ncbi:MAG: VCBS repeat-containing protein [Planctomycetes bacterium]|nr:VCBS repeat-containing protein [Planctomycetota bacterium]
MVVNEEFRDFNGNATSNARFVVLDDLTSGLAQLASGPVQGRDQLATLRTLIVATPAIGDVDGDGVGEVLFGGLTQYARFCNSASYFLMALDDAERGLAPLAGRFFTHFWSGCDSPADSQVRSVYLDALDIDGDGRDEVHANQFVFQDWVEAAPWTEVPGWRLPQAAFFRQGDFNHFDLNTSAVVAGDFTGDGRADIAVYRQDTNEIGVYGVSQLAPAVIAKMRSVPVAFHNSQVPVNPVLVPINVDTDSPVLRYDAGEYQLVFSEPLVIAALAAAPSKNGVGQNVAACRTAFGNTETGGSEEERSITVTASATVGFNVDGGPLTQSGFELKLTATAAATRLTSHAYTLAKTILFTSGSNEDLVVFTTLPLDQFTYTLLSHPDPELVGKQVVVSLPRDTITLQAERGFYNRTVPAGALRIDERVFQHVIGDPATYPTRTDMLGAGGLAVGPVSVGQGSGETEVTLDVGIEFGVGGELQLDFVTDVEATGGTLLAGYSIGAGTTSSLRVTSGQSTTYTGVVGAIDAANFAAQRYSFGLFTHVYRDPSTGREFEVLDYWIE